MLTSLVVYLMVRFRVGGKNMPWIVFVVQMSHMTFTHIFRQVADIPRTVLEISAMQMVLCMSLTMFAWDFYDGQVPIEQLDDEQRASRIVKMPSLLEFFGCVSFYPGVLVGPSMRYVEYHAWAHGTLYGQRMPNGRLAASLKQLAIATCALALVALSGSKWQYEYLINPAFAISLAPFLARVLFMQICGITARFPYYGVWKMANAGCIMSGMGYSGVDASGNVHWDRCENINVAGVEFANNLKELADNWNIRTAQWLRSCVYKRVTPPGKKPTGISAMITFIVSALWHGLYPGYFCEYMLTDTFVVLGFLQQAARMYRLTFRPIFYANPRTPNPSFGTFSRYSMPQLAYSAVSVAVNQLGMNFAGAPFVLLAMSGSTKVYNAVYWYGAVALAVSFVAFNMGFGRFMRRFHIAQDVKTK